MSSYNTFILKHWTEIESLWYSRISTEKILHFSYENYKGRPLPLYQIYSMLRSLTDKMDIIEIEKNNIYSVYREEYGSRISILEKEGGKKQEKVWSLYDGQVSIYISEKENNVNVYFKKDLLPTLLFVSQVDTMVLKLIHQTETIYSNSDFFELQHELKFLLITNKIIEERYKPLGISDLQWGKLIGNESSEYTVSRYCGGPKRWLIFSKTGIWFVNKEENEWNRIYDKEDPLLTGTIFEGELIPYEKRLENAPECLYWFIIMDCLARDADTTIGNEPHFIRMKESELFDETGINYNNSTLYVNSHTFISFYEPQEAFGVWKTLLDTKDAYGYKQDCLLFVKERANYEDTILKEWFSSININLYYKNKELFASNYNGDLIPFRGTDYYPMKIDMNIWLQENEIIQCKISEEKLIPIPFSGSLITIENIYQLKEKWNHFHNGEYVLKDTFIDGYDLQLYHTYQRKRKTILYSSIPSLYKKKILIIGDDTFYELPIRFDMVEKIDLILEKDISLVIGKDHLAENRSEIKIKDQCKQRNIPLHILSSNGDFLEMLEKENTWDIICIYSNIFLSFYWNRKNDQFWNIINKKERYLSLMFMDGNVLKETHDPAFSGFVINELTMVPYHMNFYRDYYTFTKETEKEKEKEKINYILPMKLFSIIKEGEQKRWDLGDEEELLHPQELFLSRMSRAGLYSI